MVKQFASRHIGLIVLASIFLLIPGQMLLASIRAERYASAVALVLGVVLFAGVFISATRSSTKPPEGRFQLTRPWKTTYETTRTGLWLRAAFVPVVGFLVLNIAGLGILMIDGGELPYIARYSFQFLVFAPFLYWHTRRQYFPVPSEDQPDGRSLLLRHSDEPRESSKLETMTVILGMVTVMLIVRNITDWLI